MFEKIAQLFGKDQAEARDFDHRCVLVVDDNETDLTLLRKTVEKMGHRVLTAENGKIGFEIAKLEKPDLILSDFRMPILDGMEMFKRLKEDADTKDIPVVFLTGVNTPSAVIESFDMGVRNYICKPIKPKLLASQIKTIFKECLSA